MLPSIMSSFFFLCLKFEDIDLIKNFLVIGIINKNPITSVKNPGMISNNAAKAKEIKEKHNYNMTASQYLNFQRSVAQVIEYAPEG